MRKDIKIITSRDINELYEGLTKSQKELANQQFRSFLLRKVKEERIEKTERTEKDLEQKDIKKRPRKT